MMSYQKKKNNDNLQEVKDLERKNQELKEKLEMIYDEMKNLEERQKVLLYRNTSFVRKIFQILVMITVTVGALYLMPKFASLIINNFFKVEEQIECGFEEIKYNNNCYDTNKSCSIENGSGSQKRLGDKYSECIPTSCKKNYEIKNNLCVIKIPSEPRHYIDYIFENGTLGLDYTIVTPTEPQPQLNSNSTTANNNEIYDYITKNVLNHTIQIPNEASNGYIMFVTEEELGNNDKLFLVIGLYNRGIIDLSKSYKPYSPNEYIFEINSIPQKTESREYITDILKYVENNKLSISGIVGEPGNKVKEIIIVFKN